MSETRSFTTEAELQREVDRIANDSDPASILRKGIDRVISGRIIQYQISVGGPVNSSHDPAIDVDLGERLVTRAIEELGCADRQDKLDRLEHHVDRALRSHPPMALSRGEGK